MTVLLQWEYIAIEMWDKVSFYSEQLDPKMEGDWPLQGSLENVPHAHIHSMCQPVYSYLT